MTFQPCKSKFVPWEGLFHGKCLPDLGRDSLKNRLVVDGVDVVFSLAEQVHYCTQFHVTAPVLALPV